MLMFHSICLITYLTTDFHWFFIIYLRLPQLIGVIYIFSLIHKFVIHEQALITNVSVTYHKYVTRNCMKD